MTANQSTTRESKRSIDTLRLNFEDVSDAVDELADALEAGTADRELVAETYKTIAATTVSIEDASEDVIDTDADEWRAINELRASTYHAADAIARGDAPDNIIAPAAGRTHSAAISSATTAAEHLERSRDAERGAEQ